MRKSVDQSSFLLLDCGSVSKSTKGLPIGFEHEQSFAPFDRRLF
jgi:hypothetical protein